MINNRKIRRLSSKVLVLEKSILKHKIKIRKLVRESKNRKIHLPRGD